MKDLIKLYQSQKSFAAKGMIVCFVLLALTGALSLAIL